MAVVGILLLTGGNLTLSYAERIVPTGLAALLIAVTPLWFLVLDACCWETTTSPDAARSACCWELPAWSC
jgi:hypothetical protein